MLCLAKYAKWFEYMFSFEVLRVKVYIIEKNIDKVFLITILLKIKPKKLQSLIVC